MDNKGPPTYEQAYGANGANQQAYGTPSSQPAAVQQPVPAQAAYHPMSDPSTQVSTLSYQSQPGMIVVSGGQPGVTVIQQSQAKPPNYLGLAIFATVCCNLILGVIAIVFSCMSDQDYQAGHIEEARSKGRTSKILSIVAVVTGSIAIVCSVVYVIYWMVVIAAIVSG